jgi:hypothetical protein
MNNYPKLHNAMWPGLVGKGPGWEPFIDLDGMLELTASAAGAVLGLTGSICSGRSAYQHRLHNTN